jgi:Raf kinase inhibitor-like YbhB/YbcL family protein
MVSSSNHSHADRAWWLSLDGLGMTGTTFVVLRFMIVRSRLLVLTFALLLAGAPTAVFAAGFSISANGLADDGMLTKDMAYDKTSSDGGRPCGGVNRAPGFTWMNAPANTQSFAILEVDPDGRTGLGVNHWVLYNIPGTIASISTADIAAAKYTPGRGTGDLVGYRGPCPPAADAAHHFIVTIYALDVPPTLPAGLDRDGVMAAMKGHLLGATTTIMRYQSTP